MKGTATTVGMLIGTIKMSTAEYIVMVDMADIIILMTEMDAFTLRKTDFFVDFCLAGWRGTLCLE